MTRKIEDEMAQTTMRLPRDLYRRLKRAGGERGMGEEIRRRLEASFEPESTNQKTKELLQAIAFVADETDNNYGPWSESAFAFEVVKLCVDLLLVLDRPKGDAIAPGDSTIGTLIYGDDPKEISRILVGDVVRERRASARDEKPR